MVDVYMYMTSLNLYYDEGDTYYQRYDCLKTFPNTENDASFNNIQEINKAKEEKSKIKS